MKKDTLKFLKSVFPNESDKSIQLHFVELLGEGRIGPDKSNAERKTETAELEGALEKLLVLPDDADGFAIRRACKDLSKHAKSFVENDEDELKLNGAIARLENYLHMSQIYQKGYPRLGGKDEHANSLAETVAYIFNELGEPVTEGTVKIGNSTEPSTNFGRVVKYAISYHGVGSSWLSPHRSVARKWKSGWRP